MGKSVSDYYAEKMQKLLEAQKQNAKNAPTSLSAPGAKRQQTSTLPRQANPNRSYYENFRQNTVRSASGAQNTGGKAPTRQNQRVNNGYAPPKATVQGAGVSGTKAKGGSAPKRKTPEQTLADRQREERAHAEAMDRARRARRLRKTRDALISFVLILAVFAAMCFAVYRLLFVVSDVRGEGSSAYSSEDIVRASEVMEGDHLYSFRSSVVSSLITHRLPQIKEVDVERKIPSTIVFNVTEEPCRYYADFYGEYRAISSSLRVMFSLSAEEAAERGLVLLKLPAVQKAVAGDRAEFSTLKNDSYVYDIAEAVASSALSERVGIIDLRSKYDIKLVCDNKYLMILGDSENAETKLRIAASVLEDEMFNSESKARIDLSDLSKTSVVIDDQLTFD